MTTTWTITQCDRLTSDDFITTAYWNCTTVDGGYSASSYSTCTFVSGVPIIPYSQVTQQEVLDWCWASGVDKEAVEAALEQHIEAQKSPAIATGVPWIA